MKRRESLYGDKKDMNVWSLCAQSGPMSNKKGDGDSLSSFNDYETESPKNIKDQLAKNNFIQKKRVHDFLVSDGI